MLFSMARHFEQLENEMCLTAQSKRRSELIRNNKVDELSTPGTIVSLFLEAANNTYQTLATINGLQEEDVETVLVQYEALIGNIILIRDEKSKKATPWSRIHDKILVSVQSIASCLQTLLQDDLFSNELATKLHEQVERAETHLKTTMARVQTKLVAGARVFLSTIGSYQKIPTNAKFPTPTIIVFDEAGSIPSFELLGLSRLKISIKALVCVGDKHQLPPYDPADSSPPSVPYNTTNNLVELATPVVKMQSILDVSRLTVYDFDGKILLRQQFRVPYDLAQILNICIYGGDYVTAPGCTAPRQGFHFVNVARSGDTSFHKRYINKNEIHRTKELVDQSFKESLTNIMILTPVRSYASMNSP
jgi:hypothetical protein